MPTELIEALRALADEWESAAPTITVDEVTQQRSISDEAPPTSPEITVVGGARRPNRWWVALAAAAAVALAIVAVTVLRSGEPDRRIEQPVDSGVTTTTVTTTAATNATTVPPTQQQQLADVLGAANEALSRLTSFSATATVTRGGPIIGPTATDVRIEEHTSVNRVTLMADGSLWAEGETLQWGSFDASTGVARNATLAADGTIAYQEVVGWTDNSVPLNILLGADPVPSPFFESAMDQGMELTVRDVDSHLGRPAWRIDAVDPGGAGTGTESWVIDRTTGLVVEHHIQQPASFGEQNVGVNTTDMVLDDLVTDTELPPAFPGTFPDGAAVNRSGDPNGFQLVTLDQAAQIFGSPIAVPADLPADARVRATTQRQSWGPRDPNATYLEVTIEFGEGFLRTRVTTSKSVLDPGQPVPTGSLVVDGLLCSTLDGVRCTEVELATDVGTGVFDGLPMVASTTSVDILDGGVLIRVNGADNARTTANAASLTLVGP